MTKYFHLWLTISLIVVGLISLVGCQSLLSTTNQDISTKIISTQAGPIPVNQEIEIVSNSQSSAGVHSVDFIVNGILVETTEPTFPDVQFIARNRWVPTAEGEYMIKVVAHGAGDQTAEDTVKISAKHNIIPVATGIKSEDTQPAPTSAPIETIITCTNNVALISETIPDDTTLDAAQIFNKTWRVRNTGTCAWDGYYFDHVAGPKFGGTRANLVSLLPNGEVEITTPMVAPNEGGSYTSDWRFFDAEGAPFGRIFRIKINVPRSQVCEAPKITRFEATPSTIEAGQNSTLRWEVVGAVTIKLNPGPELETADGSAIVSPANTTDYILEAKTGDCIDSKTLRVTVNPAP